MRYDFKVFPKDFILLSRSIHLVMYGYLCHQNKKVAGGRFGGKERKEISHIWTDSAAFLEIWK